MIAAVITMAEPAMGVALTAEIVGGAVGAVAIHKSCRAWEPGLLDKTTKAKEKAANPNLVGGFLFRGSLLFGPRSLSTVMAITAGAVVGDVEPRAIEDNGRGRKHAPYLAVTVWALLQRRIVEMLAALKMHPTGQTFVFVHGHDDTSQLI